MLEVAIVQPVVAAAPVALLVLVAYRPSQRARGALRLALGRFTSHPPAGLTFRKFLGSGAGGRFGVWPSLTHQGLFLAFSEVSAADEFVAGSTLLSNMRADADAFVAIRMRAYSSRGRWSGVEPFPATAMRPATGPIASLTRASIRPTKALQFWRHAPAADTAIAQATGCLLAVGLGEAPLLRQATFTIWESEAAMDAYARTGPHLAAIRAARGGRHFAEDMFTRFVIDRIDGAWPALRMTEGAPSDALPTE